jgi:Rnl2 family RNA ligase
MFVPYDKIEERWEGDPAAERALAREKWVVTEKIHGANFVVVSESGERLRYAKRKALLAPGESFFGHEVLVARLAPSFEAAVEEARAISGARTILIYGELFGGHYPHPSVTPVAGQKPVQTGVWYSPRLEFCAFDIASVHEDETCELFAYDRALALFRTAGLFAAEPLLVGSLHAATQFPVERTSTIPARLELPPLDEPNLAEGIVVKTQRPVRLPGGALTRPAFKRKIARFAEDERYAGAEKPDGAPRDSGEALGRLLEAAAALVNPPRAAAAISKIGPPTNEELRRQVIAGVRDDVLDELARREPGAMAALTGADRALLAAQLELLAEPLLPS